MMKAYCRSRWAIWLLLATLLATGFLASWLLANSFEIVLNMWFFATAPPAVIVSIDYWRFRREWQQLQDDHPIDPVQITDPLSLAYYQNPNADAKAAHNQRYCPRTRTRNARHAAAMDTSNQNAADRVRSSIASRTC